MNIDKEIQKTKEEFDWWVKYNKALLCVMGLGIVFLLLSMGKDNFWTIFAINSVAQAFAYFYVKPRMQEKVDRLIELKDKNEIYL